jgi:hypothetical protein
MMITAEPHRSDVEYHKPKAIWSQAVVQASSGPG